MSAVVQELTSAEAVDSIVKSVRYKDATSATIDGASVRASQADAGAGEAPPIVEKVGDFLYRAYYTHGRSAYGFGSKRFDDPVRRVRFSELLHEANASQSSWRPYCRFVKREGDTVTVDVGGGTLQEMDALLYEGPDKNGFGRIYLDGAPQMPDPTWYFAFGEDGLNPHEQPTIRVYWALTAEGAPLFVRQTTSLLNQQRVPFHLKCLRDPQEYGRSDAGVLYLSETAWDRATPFIRHVLDDVAPYLQKTTPLFTKKLADGLALAQDPGDGASFGRDRCRLIARAIWDVHESSTAERRRERMPHLVKRRLREQGYDPDRLHLNPGAERDFEFLSYEDILTRRRQRT